jgi:hypothetical protein
MKEELEIKKEQLLNKQSFMSHCNYDNASVHVTRKLDIDEKFLASAEMDGLIKPLMQVEEKVRQQDGTDKIQTVSYYSPFQIYIIAELRENSVLDDGLLWGRMALTDLNYYHQQNFRLMQWGSGMGFNVESANRDRNKIKQGIFNPLMVCDQYHSFLELLHGLDLRPRHQIEYDETRMFSRAPSYAYNFDLLRTEGESVLKKYDLDLDKIKGLKWHVGYAAAIIDPLERWYYYVEKHPQSRRDLLKGDAAIAQELYAIYDFLEKIYELVSGEKPKPFFEFLHPEHLPYRMPKTEYQRGEDLNALKYATQQFYKWQGESDNKTFVGPGVLERITQVGEDLKDFEKRYGDRSFAGSSRTIDEKAAVKLGATDPITRRYVDMILAQRKAQDGKEPTETEINQQIVMAIMSRLGDLKRGLQEAFWSISAQFRDKESAAWQEVNGNNLWVRLSQQGKFNNLDRVQQLELVAAERDKIRQEAESWKERAKNFQQVVAWYAEIVFCIVCKENPVQLHVERAVWPLSEPNICDDCVQKIKKSPDAYKQGEWRCPFCDHLLYKFAGNNIFSGRTQTGVPVVIELQYGLMEVEIACPKCKQVSRVEREWGWLP